MSRIFSREHIIDHWLAEVLGEVCFKREPLAGDASFRRYFRIYTPTEVFVLMDAPPPENPIIFSELATILEKQEVSVPKVHASHAAEGLLLLSDFGDRLYLKILNEQNANHLYEDAFRAAIKMHQSKAEIPSFDLAFLKRQLQLFNDWYLIKHLKINNTDKIQNSLQNVTEILQEIVESQPFVFLHLDYHSRNLMVLDQHSPGILDFQDAMRGPLTYDLVSLLQDCYITWPRSRVINWVAQFRKAVIDAGLLSDHISEATFLQWFDLTGVQRHLKNLGIFSRLHYRDGKSHYLKDMPMPRKYIREAMHYYPELSAALAPLKTVFEEEGAVCAR